MIASEAEIAAFFELLAADKELEVEEVDGDEEPDVAEDPYSLGKLLVEERSF